MTSRTLSGYEKETISKPLEQPAFADSKHDNAIVEVGGFFCHACTVDKPMTEASPDPRYCQGCYAFLLKEAEMLPDNKHPKWVPRTQSKKDSTGKNSSQKVIQVSQDVVLNMSTVNGKKSMTFSKKDERGIQERKEALISVYLYCGDIFNYAERKYLRKEVARDDILDALVAAVTTSKEGQGLSTIPENPVFDSKGLPMEMVYYPMS